MSNQSSNTVCPKKDSTNEIQNKIIKMQGNTVHHIFKEPADEIIVRLEVLNELTRYIFYNHKSTSNQNELLALQQKFLKSTDSQKSVGEILLQCYQKTLQDLDKEDRAVQLALNLVKEIRDYSSSRQKKLQFTFKNKKSFLRRGQMIKMLNDCAHTLPLWIGSSPIEKPPPLCGAIPADLNYCLNIGDLVAALIPTVNDFTKASNSNPNSSHSGDWILAEVVHVNGNRYEIDDIDEEQNERHYLDRKSLIPLPLYRANPETNPEALFVRDTHVLALYPQTTCFYRGKVLRAPQQANSVYNILFVDHTYNEGFSPPMDVPQRYVVKIPEDFDVD
ncbi:hypothetical protein NH340_JMT06816 [Sarcoptes scabiei]|nr:hypothetical protein NH340_JMT06816 [Sarcoptes scabiei]